MIPNDTVQLILETAKIEEVVEEFVPLKRRGVNMLGVCPFHNEKTPSFTVAPTKGIFKCFGCGESGNAIGFIMKHEQLSFPEAVRYLGKKYGIEVPEEQQSDEYKAEQRLADSLYLALNHAQNYYETFLWQNDYGKSVGLSYFRERGFSDATIKHFGLGFADGRQDDFSNNALKAHYQKDILQRASLMSDSGRDFFRQRVLFPVHNLSGKVVGFGGRILITDKKAPKYLNTRESEVYHKSKLLYGIFQAKKAIMKADNCYMVEGYTDVLALHQGGIENVVASSGTSLTVGQIQLIKRFTPNITILYDGDAAGIKAALRGLDLVLEQDMNVRVVLLPQGEDPDSYMRQMGAQGFTQYIEKQREDFILFKTRLLLKDSEGDPIARANLLKDIVHSIALIPDTLKRATYVRECALLLEIQEQIIYEEIHKIRIKNAQRGGTHQAQSQSDAPQNPDEQIATNLEAQSNNVHIQRGDVHQERDFIRVLMLFGHEKIKEDESVAEFMLIGLMELGQPFSQLFHDPLYAKIAEDYLRVVSENQKLNTAYFLHHMDVSIQKLASTLCLSPHEFSAGWEKFNVFLFSQQMPEVNFDADALSSLQRFKLKKIERAMQLNSEQLRQAQQQGDSLELLIPHIETQRHLQNMRNELTKGVVLSTKHPL